MKVKIINTVPVSGVPGPPAAEKMQDAPDPEGNPLIGLHLMALKGVKRENCPQISKFAQVFMRKGEVQCRWKAHLA